MSKFLSRKFMLAGFVVAASAVFVAIDKLTGAEWTAVASIAIGAFSAADAAINYVHRDRMDPPE